MTITSYPFENQETTETQYGRIMRQYQEPGVVGAPASSALAATAPGGLTVRFAAGLAHCRGMILDNDGGLPDADVSLGDASAGARVDRIVARFDPVTNRAHLHHLPGTSGSSVPPEPTRTDTGIYDVKLVRVAVGAGAAGLAVGAITDEREWASTRIRVWTSATRPSPAGLYDTGRNLDTGRIEFWDGTGWRHLLDQRDVPSRRAWTYKRDETTATDTFTGTGRMAAVTLPADSPAGVYLVTFDGTLRHSQSGSTSVYPGNLRLIRPDTTTEDRRIDLAAEYREFSPTWVYQHPGGSGTFLLDAVLSNLTIPGTVVNHGASMAVVFLGPGTA